MGCRAKEETSNAGFLAAVDSEYAEKRSRACRQYVTLVRLSRTMGRAQALSFLLVSATSAAGSLRVSTCHGQAIPCGPGASTVIPRIRQGGPPDTSPIAARRDWGGARAGLTRPNSHRSEAPPGRGALVPDERLVRILCGWRNGVNQ
jgi:hypothetical protein